MLPPIRAQDANRNREDRSPGTRAHVTGFANHRPVWPCFRCRLSPRLSPRTTLFVDVPVKVAGKIFQRALKRLDRPGSKGAERISGSEEFRLKVQGFEILLFSGSLFHSQQDLFGPCQAAPARRTPAA